MSLMTEDYCPCQTNCNDITAENKAAAKKTLVRGEGERGHTQPATVGDDQGSDSANSLQPATSE